MIAGRQAALTALLDPFGARDAADLERLLELGLAGATGSGGDANRICRLCDPDVCGHPGRCPVTQAVVA